VAQIDFHDLRGGLCALVEWGAVCGGSGGVLLPQLARTFSVGRCWGWVGVLERCRRACVRDCSSLCLCQLLVYTYRRAEKDHAEVCGCGCLAPACRAFEASACVEQHLCTVCEHEAHSFLVVQYMLSIASAFEAL
jgi:hypothetical protein